MGVALVTGMYDWLMSGLGIGDTLGIIRALQAQFGDIQGLDRRDICYATQNRQSAVKGLTALVDVTLW